MALRLGAFAAACAGLAAASVPASAGGVGPERGCAATDGCDQAEPDASVLLQASPSARAPAELQASPSAHAPAERWPPQPPHCCTRSLIIGMEVGEDTYLQWNAELTANGAERAEFLNLTNVDGPGPVRFAADLDFVKHGRPAFGIVLVRLIGVQPLANRDAAKLMAYIEAGGMLVVGESNPEQVNPLMRDLESSIRQRSASGPDVDCSTPQDAPYVPVKSPGGCSGLTDGVTGLQGDNLDAVVDREDSSYPLLALEADPSLVVARAEKKRSLVVVGDDEPFDDDCATENDGNNRFAFGETTNLRLFANLFKQRCRHWK